MAYCFFDVANIAEVQDEQFDRQIDHNEEVHKNLAVSSVSEHPELVRAHHEEKEGMQECIVKVVVEQHLEGERVRVDRHIDDSTLVPLWCQRSSSLRTESLLAQKVITGQVVKPTGVWLVKIERRFRHICALHSFGLNVAFHQSSLCATPQHNI